MQPTDHKALTFIRHYENDHGIPPSGEELAEALNLSRSWAYEILERLEREELITRPRHRGRRVGRQIRLTEAAMKHLEEPL